MGVTDAVRFLTGLATSAVEFACSKSPKMCGPSFLKSIHQSIATHVKSYLDRCRLSLEIGVKLAFSEFLFACYTYSIHLEHPKTPCSQMGVLIKYNVKALTRQLDVEATGQCRQ